MQAYSAWVGLYVSSYLPFPFALPGALQLLRKFPPNVTEGQLYPS